MDAVWFLTPATVLLLPESGGVHYLVEVGLSSISSRYFASLPFSIFAQNKGVILVKKNGSLSAPGTIFVLVSQ